MEVCSVDENLNHVDTFNYVIVGEVRGCVHVNMNLVTKECLLSYILKNWVNFKTCPISKFMSEPKFYKI